jgi:hypothetical protein
VTVLLCLAALVLGVMVGYRLGRRRPQGLPLPAYRVGSGLWITPSDELPPYLPGIGCTRPPEVIRCDGRKLYGGMLEPCGWPLQPDGSCLVAHEHWGHVR